MGETVTGHRVRPIVVIIVAAVVVAMLAFTVVVGAFGNRVDAARDGHALSIENGRCAAGIGTTDTGRSTYLITNQADTAEEVTVYDTKHRYAYGEVEMIAPRVTRTMVVVLPAGTFNLACEGDDGTVGYSDPFTVSGPSVRGVHRWIPATYGDLVNVVSRYRVSVTAGLTVLAADTDRLLAAVANHDQRLARQRWLTAHLDYERLGAAYDTFGDYADKIDGRPDGLPGGVQDPEFGGFHLLEHLLWNGGSAARELSVAKTLDHDVHGLVVAFPHQVTDPNDVALRTHEVLENSIQFELTGDTDQGSHSNLATLSANIEGTQMTLRALQPLLRQNDPALLSSARRSLAELTTTVNGYRRGGHWPPIDNLTTAQRERLNGAVAGTLEQLAPIPTELEILPTHDNG